MPNFEHGSEKLRQAREVFSAWLRERGDKSAKDFENLCALHPDLKTELQAFNSVLELGQSAAASRTFHETLREQFGDAAEVTVHLEEADDAPGASGAGGEPAQAGTHSPSARYSLEDEVARGGMGVIFRVRDRNLSRTLAMKVMTGAPRTTSLAPRIGDTGRRPGEGVAASDLSTHLGLARFLEEAQVTAQLDHPGIVPVHEVGFDAQGQPFFTMKLVKGRDLNEIFRLAREEKESWNLPRALGVIVKACQALAYAHSKGVIHRDLKPANIMVGRFGEVFVMDWGLVKITGRKDLHDIRPKDLPVTSASLHSPRYDSAASTPDSPLITMDGSVVGTPAYMSLEQARGEVEAVDQSSDIYSLGAILYNLLTGQPPYVDPGARLSPHTILARVLDGPPKRVHQLNRRAPPELIAICEKAMARAKPDRYVSSLDLAEDLQAFLDHRVVKAYRTGAAAEFRSWVVRNKGLAASAAVIAILPAIGMAAFIHQQNLARERLRENLYVADMNVAQQALAESNAGHALDLLSKYVPKGHEKDLRGFEWRHLWSRAQGDDALVLRGHSNMVAGVAFSADGRELASIDIDGAVKLWNLPSGQFVTNLFQFSGRGLNTSFSRDGRYLAAGGWGEARIWDRQRGQWMLVENRTTSRAIFSPVAPMVALSSESFFWFGSGGEAVLWNYSGSRSNALRLRNSGGRVAFSADGRLVASGLGNGKIHLWDSATGKHVGQAGEVRSLDSLTLSRNGEWLAAAIDGSISVRVWSVPDGQWLADLTGLPGHQQRVVAVAASPTANLLASSGRDPKIRLWDMDQRKVIATLSGHGSEVAALTFSSDGEWLASASKDETVRVWKVAAGREADVVTNASCEGGLQIPLLSPDGRMLAANTSGHELGLFDLASRQLVRVLAPGRQPLAFSPGGDILVSITTSGLLETWDVKTGASRGGILLPCKPHREARTCLSPDASLVAAATGDEMVLCDARNGRQRAVLPKHGGLILGAAFSPDGRQLATASQDRLVRVWNVEDARLSATLRGHKADVRGVVFSPNGQLLVTAAHDNLIKVWQLKTGTELLTLRGHKSPINWVAFTPDGGTLISAADDGVRLWNVATWRQLGAFEDGQRRQLLTIANHGNVMATGDAGVPNAPIMLFRAPETAEMKPALRRRSDETASRPWLLTNLPPVSRLALRPEAVPPRSPDTPAECLDLTPFYNCSITENWANLRADGNTLDLLPRGLQHFGGVPWDIRGLIILDSVRQRRELPIFPVRVSDIPIHRRIRRAHFLCAASWGSSPGEEIGRWTFHTAEGATLDRPIRLGTDVLDWWTPAGTPPPQGMTMAWTGVNPASAKANWRIRLFLVTWDNPRPEVEIRSLDFISSMGVANPFLLAITVE